MWIHLRFAKTELCFNKTYKNQSFDFISSFARFQSPTRNVKKNANFVNWVCLGCLYTMRVPLGKQLQSISPRFSVFLRFNFFFLSFRVWEKLKTGTPGNVQPGCRTLRVVFVWCWAAAMCEQRNIWLDLGKESRPVEVRVYSQLLFYEQTASAISGDRKKKKTCCSFKSRLGAERAKCIRLTCQIPAGCFVFYIVSYIIIL